VRARLRDIRPARVEAVVELSGAPVGVTPSTLPAGA
jgi:hypothetical protein